MPVSSRRRTRRQDVQLQETSDAEAPDSSPSRPSNKKRKVSAIVLIAFSRRLQMSRRGNGDPYADAMRSSAG
jgi:hypothetical protein